MRILAVALAIALSITSPVKAETAPPTGCGFQSLGTLPLTGATTAGTARDGARVYSVTSSASGPAMLGVRNAADATLVAERPLPYALGSWAVTVAPDHSVYVGSYNSTAGAMGRLFRYDPATARWAGSATRSSAPPPPAACGTSTARAAGASCSTPR
ncbi:hypothetical protein ACQP2T_28505 [Nonomuraea sp. CA-143628]|uniref:hypothetical protein n=1 Tax=Nonomuraea sp. CA-143628 TaxID=3239997 RepID=UPI003D8ACDF3